MLILLTTNSQIKNIKIREFVAKKLVYNLKASCIKFMILSILEAYKSYLSKVNST